MATTTRWSLRYPIGTDSPADVPLWMNRLATDLDAVAMDDQGVLASRPVSSGGSPGLRGRYYKATDTNQMFRDYGTGWDEIPFVNFLPVRLCQNILVAGTISVPVGTADVIPPFFVAVKTGGAAKIVKLRDKIESGTSVTYKIQKNGSDIYTGEATTTTATTTDVADNTLADDDRLQVIVTAISGAPTGLSIGITIEYLV